MYLHCNGFTNGFTNVSHDQQVHVRGGSIIPGKGAGLTTAASRQTNSSLFVVFDDDGNASGDLYIDDGESVKPTQ